LPLVHFQFLLHSMSCTVIVSRGAWRNGGFCLGLHPNWVTRKVIGRNHVDRLELPIPYSGLRGNASRHSPLWLLCPTCLRQRRLCLRQPERHVHGAVELDGSRKFSTGPL